jgi:hypothetical protein
MKQRRRNRSVSQPSNLVCWEKSNQTRKTWSVKMSSARQEFVIRSTAKRREFTGMLLKTPTSQSALNGRTVAAGAVENSDGEQLRES